MRIRTRNSRGKRARQGFTLVEVLTALAVLVLLTGFVVAGVGTATKVYRQEEFAAQAEILASTAESALSDPVRFMKTETRKDGSQTVVRRSLTYNGITIHEPVLGAAPTQAGKQVLYLNTDGAPETERVKLLNEGIYGDCTIALLSEDGTPVDEIPLAPSSTTGLVTVNCSITSVHDASLSKTFEFNFAPLGNSISKKEAAGS